MEYIFPFQYFFLKHLGFTKVLADKLHVFCHFSGNMGNLVEMFHFSFSFTVTWCSLFELLTQCEEDCVASKAFFVLMAIICLSSLIIMLCLASLTGFLEDKATQK